jgi:hypothetical protein
MLSAGFKFMCCSTEDDADNPKINWNENLLSMQNLQVREQEINNQVTLTFVAGGNEFVSETPNFMHRKNFSGDGFNGGRKRIVRSLRDLTRANFVGVWQALDEI